MSGEMIAIVAVGVALAGCGKTWRGWNRGWMRGSTAWNPAWMGASRRWNLGLMGWNVSLANCASAWRTWKGCWKDCARPSPCGQRPARDESGHAAYHHDGWGCHSPGLKPWLHWAKNGLPPEVLSEIQGQMS